MILPRATFYSITSARFQRLKLKYDKPLSNLAFKFNLLHYVVVGGFGLVAGLGMYGAEIIKQIGMR